MQTGSLPPSHPVAAARGSYVRRNLTGVLAVALGLACLALAVLPERLIEPPRLGLATEIRNLVREVATGAVAPDLAAYRETMRRLEIASAVAGLAAAALLVVARIRREDTPLLWAGAALVAFGLAWGWIVIGIVVGIVLATLMTLRS